MPVPIDFFNVATVFRFIFPRNRHNLMRTNTVMIRLTSCQI